MKYLFVLLLSLVLACCNAIPVYADVNDFVINHFDARYVLDNDKPGGSLSTRETIEVTFSDNNHGILRAIPKSYQGYSTKLNITSVTRDGRSEPYTTYTENNNLVLKIGDADKTVTGRHVYTLDYSQERVVYFRDGVTEFNWDVNGDQWRQPFDSVTAELTIKPSGLSSNTSRACYTGILGSSDKNCTSSQAESGQTFRFTSTERLEAAETMTIAVGLEGIGFTKPTTKDRLLDYRNDAIGIAAGLLIVIGTFGFWVKNGKDYPGRKIIVPEYEPPKGLTPAEVGMLADYKVDGKDITATLIDLAVRKYVRLHEDVSKVLFFTSRKYSVELLNSDVSALKMHEKNLLEGLFSQLSVGQKVELQKINRVTMTSKIQSARKELKKSLRDNYGYLESKSDKLTTVFLVVGFILFFASFFAGSLLGLGGVVGGIIAACGFLAFGAGMQRRSHTGVEMLEKILGLKLFMNVAEKDRLNMMQSVDRPFAAPTKTPELYEKLLPFAVALGVEKSWAKQFDGILTEKPDWVTSNNIAAFSAASLATSVNGVTSSFGKSFEASSGASSSGGGSAGGGGGGGGGGGW